MTCATIAAARLAPVVARRPFPLTSVGFSGAGFLGCYHVGVSACLMDHGHLLRPGEVPSRSEHEHDNDDAASAAQVPPILTGVSAGSIVSAGISAGVGPDDSMDIVLDIARRTREGGGALDVLFPGFSLVDQVPDLMLRAARKALGGTGEEGGDYDLDLFQRRVRGGRALRIGLADRRSIDLSALHDNLVAYCYVDQYRDVEDMVAASVLSSFIPGLTGTLRGPSCPHNQAVRRAWNRIQEMQSLGFIKDGKTGVPLQNDIGSRTKECDELNPSGQSESIVKKPAIENKGLRYFDGGLVNLCPVIDDETVMVTPLHGSYSPNPSISPLSPDFDTKESDFSEESLVGLSSTVLSKGGNIRKSDDDASVLDSLIAPLRKYLRDRPLLKRPTVQVHERITVGVDSKNVETLYRMMRCSDDDVLQERFRNGYDDARRFLDDRNLLTVQSA